MVRTRSLHGGRWPPLLFVQLAPEVADEDSPHADVGVKQDLKVLVTHEVDLSLHVIHETFHLIEIGAHLLGAVG